MKRKIISSDNCVIEKSYGTVRINDTPIEKLVSENLPEDVTKGKSYAGKIYIEINVETNDVTVFPKSKQEVKENGTETNGNSDNE